MEPYQILSKKYRPQTFAEVLAQENTITTLKNALLQGRVANAYLFCGTRGTGKTTIARLFAKALNCPQRSETGEPCNACSSCREITEGHSLDVTEIDGASNRGIDDIRELNENTFYAPSSAAYKIYIIDEVHMLTKEAFNALLKTLEEPPPNVKFFFATTEAHKILPTIVSRCQRFDLKRPGIDTITDKLRFIARDADIAIPDDALALIAKYADGSLRDGESLLDQTSCALGSAITYKQVADLLGAPSNELYLQLDHAFDQGAFAEAFAVAQSVYAEGREIAHFLEGLAEHYRNIYLLKLKQPTTLTSAQQAEVSASLSIYTDYQLLTILEYLTKALSESAKHPWKQIHLEMTLLHILRQKNAIAIDELVSRLNALSPQSKAPEPPPRAEPPEAQKAPQEERPPKPQKAPEQPPSPPPERSLVDRQKHERTLRFAAVELGGTVKK